MQLSATCEASFDGTRGREYAVHILREEQERLPAQALVGNRFRIESLVAQETGTEFYRAIDTNSGASVGLRMCDVPASATARKALEADLPRAQQATHQTLAPMLEYGLQGDRLFVAMDLEEGHSLRELVDAKRAEGGTIGAAAGLALLKHVVAGLAEAYKTLAHGAICPSSIWMSKSGRVILTDLGLARGTPGMARRTGPYMAPEIESGGQPTAQTDVYSLGVVLHELLTGALPGQAARPPSQTVPGLPPAVDEVVAHALALVGRYQTPMDLLSAFETALSARAPAPAPASIGPGVASGTRITFGRSFDVARAAGIGSATERWLVHKDKLDFGPFSLDQVKQQLEKGIFTGDHIIVDLESGARQKIKDHAHLDAVATSAEASAEAVRRSQAEMRTVSVERAKSRVTWVILGTAFLVVGAGLSYYLTDRKAARTVTLGERTGEADVNAFLSKVQLDLTQKKRTRGARRGGGKDDPFRGGKDDPFSGNMDLGDVGKSGGEEVLDEAAVSMK